MKKILLIAGMLFGFIMSGVAAVYNYGYTPLFAAFTFTVMGIGFVISAIFILSIGE